MDSLLRYHGSRDSFLSRHTAEDMSEIFSELQKY